MDDMRAEFERIYNSLTPEKQAKMLEILRELVAQNQAERG